MSADGGVLSPVPIDAPVLATSLVVPCDGAVHQVPMGGSGTRLTIADPDPTARMWIVNGLGPIPVRDEIAVSGRLSAAGVGGGVACNGTDGAPLVIERIVNATFPTVGTSGA